MVALFKSQWILRGAFIFIILSEIKINPEERLKVVGIV
jgi:hypothetical protein